MELIMAIIFFIMFLVILGIFIYFIYDYMTYKDVVDKTVILMRDIINNSNMVIKGAVETTKSEIRRLDRNISAEKLRNENDYEKINTIESNLNRFDTNLKRYFQFTSNNHTINDKLYQFTFDPNVDYRINLMRRVNAAAGITIGKDQDLQICNANSNCVKLSVDGNAFNIASANAMPSDTTSRIDFMQVKGNDQSRTIFTKFDMQDNSIYFGGVNNSISPMYVSGATNDVFVKENKFNIRPYNSEAYRMGTIREGSSNLANWIDELNKQNIVENSLISQTLQQINTGLYSAYSNIEAIASYAFNVISTTIDGSTVYNNVMHFNIMAMQDIYFVSPSTIIEFKIHKDVFGMQGDTPSKSTEVVNGAFTAGKNVSIIPRNKFNNDVDITANLSFNGVYFIISLSPTNANIGKTDGIIKSGENCILYLTGKIIQPSGPSRESYPFNITNTNPASGVVAATVTNNKYPSTYIPSSVKTSVGAYTDRVTNFKYYHNPIAPDTAYQSRLAALKSPFEAKPLPVPVPSSSGQQQAGAPLS